MAQMATILLLWHHSSTPSLCHRITHYPDGFGGMCYTDDNNNTVHGVKNSCNAKSKEWYSGDLQCNHDQT